MPRFLHPCLAPILLSVLLVPSAAGADNDVLENMISPEDLQIFPYRYVDYTQEGHDYRLWNSRVVVLGQIESIRTIEGTEKLLDRSVTLRVESFLLMDRPELQKNKKEIRFRCLPLREPFEDMKEGDRCLVLLNRDDNTDNALILPADFNYYPVSEEGVVKKLFKEFPTKDDPRVREISLSAFLRDIRNKLRAISIEEQARKAELLLTGTVTDTHQGKDTESDYFIAEIAVEKVFKGGYEKDLIKIYALNDMERHTLETLNRPVFREGQKVFIFANKDPTLSAQRPGNPSAETHWKAYMGQQSVWSIFKRKVWRRGALAIEHDEFFQIIEDNIVR